MHIRRVDPCRGRRWSNTWTGIIGGILTIGVGILLLVTAGTTDLTGILGASDQAALEGAVLEGAGGVPDWVVIAVAAAIAVIGWLIVRRCRDRRPRGPEILGRASAAIRLRRTNLDP